MKKRRFSILILFAAAQLFAVLFLSQKCVPVRAGEMPEDEEILAETKDFGIVDDIPVIFDETEETVSFDIFENDLPGLPSASENVPAALPESSGYDEMPDDDCEPPDPPGEETGELPDELLPEAGAPREGEVYVFEEEPLSDQGDTCDAADLSSPAVTVYDLNSLAPFAGRSREDIAQLYSQALSVSGTYLSGDESTYYSAKPSLSAPYRAGKLSADTLSAMTAMTDFYRCLAGAPCLLKAASCLNILQKAAVVRNFSYGLTVSSGKPGDMDTGFWNEGASARPDLLAHHAAPADSIGKMINTGYNRFAGTPYWYSMESRELLLDPELSHLSFGYAGDVVCGTARAFDNTSAGLFTAFPAPGFMPSELVDPAMSAWSCGFDGDVFEIPSEGNLRVKIENADTGGSYICSLANGKLKISGSSVAFVQPASKSGYAGKNYRVTISGLTKKDGGTAVEVTYLIHFGEMLPLVVSQVSKASFEYTDLVFGKEWGSEYDLRMASVLLPSSVLVSAASGETCEIPVTGGWTVDRRNSCFRASADPSALPPNMSDTRGILSDLRIPFTIEDSGKTRQSLLEFSSDPAVSGAELEINVLKWDMTYNLSRIYRITSSEGGSYSGELFLDSDSSQEFMESSRSSSVHRFRLAAADRDLAGKYVGIYRYSQFADTAYVTQTAELTFQEPSAVYQVYLAGGGWRDRVRDGQAASCQNFSKRVSAFRICVENDLRLSIRYSYAKKDGLWSGWVYDGETAGTFSKTDSPAEAVKIRLSGPERADYDIYYCVYSKGYGWLGWTKNGKPAGTRKCGSDIRGIRVMLVEKGGRRPEKTGRYSRSFILA